MNEVMTYAQALREAQYELLENDEDVFLIGLGVPTPTGVFGTTAGLEKQFGEDRVMDMPASENAMTGVVLGASIMGFKPILIHHRVDFSLLSMEQIFNQAAKWHYMYGKKMTAPIVIRMIIGRGWGQGPQHSQSLAAVFSHFPGLKVVTPTFANDAKHLLIAATNDPSPVIFLEHRWLYDVSGNVSNKIESSDGIGKAKKISDGSNVTLVSYSYATLEALDVKSQLEKFGYSVEIIDLRTVKPLDFSTIKTSVLKTKNLVILDIGQAAYGIGTEIISTLCQDNAIKLTSAPLIFGLPDIPTPTSHSLSAEFYPNTNKICESILKNIFNENRNFEVGLDSTLLDKPNVNFQGPY